MYDDLHYARQRLNDTFIRYQGLPVFVQEIGGNFALSLYSYGTKETINININNPDLDFKPIPLGYVNHPNKIRGNAGYKIVKTAFYLERTPQRRMKQGLSGNSVICRHHNIGNGVRNTLLQLPLYNLLAENFRTYEQVAKEIKANESIAFDRRLAIRKEAYGPKVLMYKGQDIGYFEAGVKSFVIGEDHMYLKELLKYHGVQCHDDA